MIASTNENAIGCAAYCEGRRVANFEIGDICTVLKEPDKFVWIGLHEPTTEMLVKLQQEFALHEIGRAHV